ncbi:radical SAM protein [Methanoculleus sp.]|uniref:radical SAM/SPASM domain-containing protein n=1 Tax=Methanoculleus sp. TaxID=90427 RepID=UPI0025F36440|nr:radical SAM protein [Methanoculleus sp.]MCK9317765.1 radical SAM protein [Methanoculleus sp.]MDD2254847.1 radical SAM protein [Methanoculleus sp.]MDD2787675.1 radical SAM protein [Methanoculleus sp.]MDD4314654.1 radical SAM protein [Methanoculleus sp.]
MIAGYPTRGEAAPAAGDNRYRETFDATIRETLGQAVRIIAAEPALAIPGAAILRHQKRAAAARKRHEQEGLLVPPVMIVSVTARCNLACAGCYMHGRGGNHRAEMEPEVLASVVDEATGLGVSIVVLAGGEPLVRMEEIFCLVRAHPQVLFAVFTNGLLIDGAVADLLAGCRNVVPVISFEGSREHTDRRRGDGVYDRLLSATACLKDRNVFFGCSLTTTRENFADVTDEAFVRQMLLAGVRVFTYVEYVPMAPGTEDLVLAPEQKTELQAVLASHNRQFPALFIGFPGDEDAYGGCLAAGRGFVHVSPSGDLEPCPAAPYSDVNLAAVPLREALRSRLLNRLRETPEALTESEGGCALWANRAWVEALIGREEAPAGMPGGHAAAGGPEKGIVAVTAEHDDAMGE